MSHLYYKGSQKNIESKLLQHITLKVYCSILLCNKKANG